MVFSTVMVLVLDGSTEIGAHVKSHCLLIDGIKEFEMKSRPTLLHACPTCSDLPSDISTMNKIQYETYFQSACRPVSNR